MVDSSRADSSRADNFDVQHRTRRAGVLGSPVAHSRSPQIHLAAYNALGLTGWTYERIDCTAQQLPSFVSGLDTQWVGLSVTMPAKFAAFEFADMRTERAELAGSANTLTRMSGGWRADCTDIDGVTAALHELGIGERGGAVSMVDSGARPNPTRDLHLQAVIIGAGGTSHPALVSLACQGFKSVTLVVRNRERAQNALACAARNGLHATTVGFDDSAVAKMCSESDVVISTVPVSAVASIAESVAGASRVVDVIYHPWPTPLAQKVIASGGKVVGGLVMLLHQAFGQVEQFTGMPAPRKAMAEAISR